MSRFFRVRGLTSRSLLSYLDDPQSGWSGRSFSWLTGKKANKRTRRSANKGSSCAAVFLNASWSNKEKRTLVLTWWCAFSWVKRSLSHTVCTWTKQYHRLTHFPCFQETCLFVCGFCLFWCTPWGKRPFCARVHDRNKFTSSSERFGLGILLFSCFSTTTTSHKKCKLTFYSSLDWTCVAASMASETQKRHKNLPALHRKIVHFLAQSLPELSVPPKWHS